VTLSTQWYLDSIERELADLPADERAELLEDLAAHFSEFESHDDLMATLGDPAVYARELRDAAGLLATPPDDTHVALVDRVRANLAAVRRSAWWRAVTAFTLELRPAWWVLRAWLIVAAISEGPPGSGGIDFPIPRVADNTLVGLAALMLIVPVSVVLGQQARSGQRKGLNVALTVFGALFFLILPASANDDSRGTTWNKAVATTGPGPSTVARPGQAATNDIWGYDTAGNAFLVSRVVPTQNGAPASRAIIELQALCPSDLVKGPARVLRTADGAPIVCVGERAPTPTLGAPTPSTAPTTTVAPTTTTITEPTR
jgi:hypothetical protein